MVRSILEYGATIWDPYIKREIEQLERIQRRGARFIKKDYKSREEGCVTKMLQELELTSLEDRRRQQRLIFLHKVVEGQIPAMPPLDYLEFNKDKRQIKPKKFSDCVTTNIVEKSSRNNSRSLKIPEAQTEQYKNSFFVRTLVEWNQLEDNIVQATKPEDFKAALLSRRCD